MRSSFFALLLLLICCGCSTGSDEQRALYDPQTSNRSTPTWSGFNNDCEYLAVMGDVQTYVSIRANIPYFVSTMEWVRNQVKRGAPLKAMLFVGDLTDNNADRQQWINCRDCMNIAADVLPTVTVSGNHDFDWSRDTQGVYSGISDRNSCHLSEYADTRLFHKRIVDTFTPDSIDNVVFSNEIHGERIDIVALEFGPRPEVLEWAERHIRLHPDRRFIILTHELLNADGSFVTSAYSTQQFGAYGLPHSTPEQVFQTLAYPHKNVIAMLCGHNGFSRMNTTRRNSSGVSVPIVLFNLQYQLNGGDGMIELWEFPKDTRTVNIKIVDTKTGDIVEGEDTAFSFTYR